jgi:hypothetical protein
MYANEKRIVIVLQSLWIISFFSNTKQHYMYNSKKHTKKYYEYTFQEKSKHMIYEFCI